jgi:G:T/U-mismatch repair DNA glycosylase
MGRRRPKTISPWEDVSEEHPWKQFPKLDNRKYLILGSFPPNKFTSHKERLSVNDQDFFYGSQENSFWDLFLLAFGLEPKLSKDIEQLKLWLRNNGWVVSDIVAKTKRKADSAFDSDLMVEQWNTEIIAHIFKTNDIRLVYFTSKYVEANFFKYVYPLAQIANSVNFTTLISPSKNGLRMLKSFKDSFKIHPLETLTDYRKRYYVHHLAIPLSNHYAQKS